MAPLASTVLADVGQLNAAHTVFQFGLQSGNDVDSAWKVFGQFIYKGSQSP